MSRDRDISLVEAFCKKRGMLFQTEAENQIFVRVEAPEELETLTSWLSRGLNIGHLLDMEGFRADEAAYQATLSTRELRQAGQLLTRYSTLVQTSAEDAIKVLSSLNDLLIRGPLLSEESLPRLAFGATMKQLLTARLKAQQSGRDSSNDALASLNMLILRLIEPLRTNWDPFYLVSVIGTDERELLEGGFKLTYLFSHPTDDMLLFVEVPVALGPLARAISDSGTGEYQYRSILNDFAAVEPFEEELVDMLGLAPSNRDVTRGTKLHQEAYPPKLFPLRRNWPVSPEQAHAARLSIERHKATLSPLPPAGERISAPSNDEDGTWVLPVGPVHAGVIEPGYFEFLTTGEVIDDLHVRLGYAHKGIESLFETSYTLNNGWYLAEHVTGDSPVGHSVAYCHAIEALAQIRPPVGANLLRGLFLELERMANHIGDCAALADDVSSVLAGAELAALRERLLQLNRHISGHRLLRGRDRGRPVNQVGGMTLPWSLKEAEERIGRTPGAELSLKDVILKIARDFDDVAASLTRDPNFRERLKWTGILTRRRAIDLGITGLAARASGVRRDFRVQHPSGIYIEEDLRNCVAASMVLPLLVTRDDLSELQTMASRLYDSDALGNWVLSQLDYEQQQRLKSHLGVGPREDVSSRVEAAQDDELRDALARAFNRLIQSRDAEHAQLMQDATRRGGRSALSILKLGDQDYVGADPLWRRTWYNRRLLEGTFSINKVEREKLILDKEASAGDCFARYLIRIREVQTSAKIIEYILSRNDLDYSENVFLPKDPESSSQLDVAAAIKAAPNFEFGIGYAEGWRGDIIYWVMKSSVQGIYRCKVRDPSTLNWRGLVAAVKGTLDDEYLCEFDPPASVILTDAAPAWIPDFPIINKSFNLSYSGHDL